ncbi:MAG TPA: ribosomal RNA small subunit methyltransferase A [Candidatus Omnitrophica bacterium]|nr:MAG: ribosomal RNA small subunit methyltransferase A [Omnitrophica WOR_2 bacterium GWA2_45_18]OGX18625.1 MAG: ribosomal RNA small subunit methyltransferase A [Omnitrophica WOR_2 bacterium GWC2_45_7]HBR15493.1 ribosomal RNA small subunit methyltransferase A [Candidatus Omnitrophota bacterium]
MNQPRAPRFIPKKSLGQNFLINPHIRDKMIAACHLKKEDMILEIGPGRGVLTEPLAQRVKSVLAVETDKRLVDQLQDQFKNSPVEIVHADILSFPFETLPAPIKIIGNLPYNIATPIIEKVIRHREKIDSFYLTVQLEHGLRMLAAPHSKDYGSLSCFVQYYAKVKKIFNIKNTAFAPPPKVQSCFLEILFYKDPPFQADNDVLLFKIIRQAFGHRRKTILNSLSGMRDKESLHEVFTSLNINPTLRAENLSLRDYVRIANVMSNLE